MADRFHLSLWLKDYDDSQMLDRYRILLETFPFSKLRPRIRGLRICPLSWSEHPVLEEDFSEEGADPGYILLLASEFFHGDYAYEAAGFWDLWRFQRNGGPGAWKQAPAPVTLLCFGPEFEEGTAERGHLAVDFGLDTPFRADQTLPDAESQTMAGDYRERLQENIRKLLGFVHELDKRLPIQRKLLWTESGANFAQMIRQSLQ
jgi:hypothetical protein